MPIQDEAIIIEPIIIDTVILFSDVCPKSWVIIGNNISNINIIDKIYIWLSFFFIKKNPSLDKRLGIIFLIIDAQKLLMLC